MNKDLAIFSTASPFQFVLENLDHKPFLVKPSRFGNKNKKSHLLITENQGGKDWTNSRYNHITKFQPMKRPLLIISLLTLFVAARSQTNYTWNGSVSTAWNTAANWTPNGIPGSIDNVTIVTGSNTCQLAASQSIGNFTLTSGTLDLGAVTLTINGATVTFTKGTVQHGTLNVPSATTTGFGGGPVIMNCPVTITTATISQLKNTTFQQSLTIDKTGSSGDANNSGDIFNGVLNFTNSGTGAFYFGNGAPDQFNANATFTNSGSNNLGIGWNSTGNVFNGLTTFNNTGTNGVYVSWYSVGTTFNGNVAVTSNNGQGVQFCGGNSTAAVTMAAGDSIYIAAGGFSAGNLLLRQITQSDATPLNFNLTGTGDLIYGPSSTFLGTVNSSSAALSLNGATFNGTTNFTKTGATGDWSNGGNTFNAVCSITNSGGSYLVLGNVNPDTWNSDVTLTDNGLDRLLPGWNSAGNQFNGNIYVNTAGSAAGIQFCGGSSTATATQAAGKTIIPGSTGLTAGYLYLKQFTQLGSTPITITATGTSVLYLGPSSSFGGPVTVTAPDIWAQGATYSSAAVFTKTGGSSNHNNQNQNIFNSTCTINQQSSTGYFMLGYNSNDLFNDNVTVTSTGTGGIYLGWTSGTGTPTLAAGKTILVGSAGFSAGYLYLNTFTQNGAAPMNLAFTGTNTALYFARQSIFGGNLTVTAPDIYLNGSTFNGTFSSNKTGSNGDWNNGGNTFNGICTIANSSAGYIVLGNVNPDTWNADVNFIDSGSERILPAWATAGNQFNGNIYVNTAGSAQGIQFCGGNATATSILAAGKTVIPGSIGLNSGYLNLKQFTQNGSAPMNLILNSTASYLQFGPSSAIGGNVTSSSPGLLFNGCTFSGTVTSTKNGSTNDAGSGNNVFNGAISVTDSGSGYLMFGNNNPDQYNAAATFTNAGTSNVYVAYNSVNNVFSGVTTFNNTPSGNNNINVSAYSAGTTFNNNIVVNSTSGQGVQFCTGNATATASLASGYTISVGSPGFSIGTLTLRQFTQNGSTAQTLNLTGASGLIYGPLSSFGGNVTSSSPALMLNGCTFNGTSNLTKTGTTGDWSNGGNVFNGVSSITNSGTSYVVLGNVSPDTWNSDVIFTDNGSERLLPCWATAGNQFNGNIYVNTGGSAQGIQFCGGNTTATAIQASGMTVLAGSAGLNAGYLILKQFTQNGNATVNLTLNSTATYLQFGPSSTIGGNVVSFSPGLYLNGCTFNGTVNSTKTGTSNDGSTGNNIFNDVTVLTDAGTGYLMLGNSNFDQFNANATFNNTGAGNIYVAYNSANNVFGGVTTFNNTPSGTSTIYVGSYSAGTIFNGNIVVSSTAGGGVQFCTGNTTATAILSSGNTISVGSGGFSTGTLLLRQFTQQGATAQGLSLTGSGNLTFGPSSNFGGAVTSTSGALFFNGCTFAGTVTAAKTGTSSDNSSGNNLFNGPFAVTNTGTGYFLMGNTYPDTWRSTASFTNQSSSSHMYIAYNSPGNVFDGDVTYNNQSSNAGIWIYPDYYGTNTQFNGNIFVSNTTGAGIYFGAGTGTATLTGGGSVGVNANGFNVGNLVLKNFTQATSGSTQTITATGTSIIQYGPTASFAGPVTSSSPGVTFNSSTFNGVVNVTKTGGSNDQSYGNNTFNASSTFTNSGSGYLEMTVSASDSYNSDVTFTKTGSGALSPNYNNTGTYNGNMTVGSTSAITFGSGSGTAVFAGSGTQNINATAGSVAPVFTRLVINNTGGGVTLNGTPVNVSGTLTLTSGLLNTTMTNILTMLNGSTTAAGTALSTSYVNGPMRYQKSSSGTSTLNFPVGTAPDCRPVVLTVNHGSSTLYNYTIQLYNASAVALGYSYPPSIQVVSHVHYYVLGRTDASGTSQPNANLSGNQTIQIFFGADDVVTDGSTLTIAKNTYSAPTAWIDIGGNGAPAYNAGASLIGSVTSTSSPSAFNSFSTFTLANRIGGSNVLPTELLYFNAKPDNSQVDLTWATAMEANSNYFTVERSSDGIAFDSLLSIGTLASGGNSNLQLDYSAYDLTPLPGNSYYRLKQTNLDGSTKYSGVVSVNFTKQSPIGLYPNPTTGTVYVSGLSVNATAVQVGWYDLSGKLLLQGTATPQGGMLMLNTHFNNGDYILRLTNADGSCTTRTVIILK
jgi:Secretion system C-terminal sorting domain